MAEFVSKSGKIRAYAERSEREDAVNVGVESGLGRGFASVPTDKRSLLRCAAYLSAAALPLLLRGKKCKDRARRAPKRSANRRRGRFGR